tara:strand:+ start:233 stop:700 length:468 start_codon:yes stop_codon:yes gene_type:complete
MKSYKRRPIDREITFNIPNYECFACNDSGIVHNSDGLINNHFPDYDILDNGKRSTGSDLALICHCSKANTQHDIDGSIISHGFRTDTGQIRNNLGVDIPIDVARDIHNLRKKRWYDTQKLMNKIIAKNIKQNKTNLPPEVQKVKDQLRTFTMKSL